MNAVVGVDIGGTKTQWRAVCPESGVTLAEGFVPSQLDGDQHVRARWLAGELRAGVPVAALGVGAHGCDSRSACLRLRDALAGRLEVPVRVVNDVELIPVAAGLPRAIGLVAGTGSIATGAPAGSEAILVGGWGWVLGDEGSAPGLVREAARAVCGHHDGGQPPDELTAGMLEAFGVDEIPELSAAMMNTASAEGWGRHAPVIFGAADVGSALATAVIRDGAKSLADLVDQLVSRGVRAEAVIAAGGVLSAQPRLFEELRQHVAWRHPDLPVRPLGTEPVDGAVILARSLLA